MDAGGGASVEHGREPCPDRIIDDVGGAFGMGAVGGSIWHFVKGIRNSPSGGRMAGGIQVCEHCSFKGRGLCHHPAAGCIPFDLYQRRMQLWLGIGTDRPCHLLRCLYYLVRSDSRIGRLLRCCCCCRCAVYQARGAEDGWQLCRVGRPLLSV